MQLSNSWVNTNGNGVETSYVASNVPEGNCFNLSVALSLLIASQINFPLAAIGYGLRKNAVFIT
jgi:hypothetical protein